MAETYRIDVEMDGGPFTFDNTKPTILQRAELEKLIERSGGRPKSKTKPESGA